MLAACAWASGTSAPGTASPGTVPAADSDSAPTMGAPETVLVSGSPIRRPCSCRALSQVAKNGMSPSRAAMTTGVVAIDGAATSKSVPVPLLAFATHCVESGIHRSGPDC